MMRDSSEIEEGSSMKKLVGVLISLCVPITINCSSELINIFRSSKTDFPVYLPDEDSKLVRFKTGLGSGGFSSIKWETKLLAPGGMKDY
jgi:hypothetical protein